MIKEERAQWEKVPGKGAGDEGTHGDPNQILPIRIALKVKHKLDSKRCRIGPLQTS